jgi:hypothetical protein
MDEAERVLERLERIQALNESRASAGVLLAELRELVVEAEHWARVEGDTRARAAAAELSHRLARIGEVVPLAVVGE